MKDKGICILHSQYYGCQYHGDVRCQHISTLQWRHNGHDTITSQITSLTIVYSIVYSDTDQRKHQSSASLAFVRGIHRGPVNSPHKWPVTRQMFPFDDIIMSHGIDLVFLEYWCSSKSWVDTISAMYWALIQYKHITLSVWEFPLWG